MSEGTVGAIVDEEAAAMAAAIITRRRRKCIAQGSHTEDCQRCGL